MNRPEENWWTRPCGGLEVMRIALPLVISTGSWSLLLFFDRMLLLWSSEAEMAAAFPAGMLYWTMISLPLGVAGYVNTFVAQYHGAKRPQGIGLALTQGIRLGMATVPLFLLAIPLAPLIFTWAGHDSSVLPYEIVYFQILACGAGATVVAAAQSSFYTGRGVTWVVMLVDVSSVLLNIVLDYVWIFGLLGFPAMGIAGAAWATVVSQWMKVGVYWLLIRRPANQRAFHFAEARFDRPLAMRLLRFGGPSGLQFLLEALGFTMIVMLMGRLGRTELSATTLAFQINAVAFVPMIGVGIAVSTLVGQQITSRRPDLAARATWTATVMSLAYTGLFAVSYLAIPDMFLLGHAAGVDAEEFARLRDLTVVLLRFVAAYCIFDAMQFVFSSAIKGAGDTRFVLITTAVLAILGVSVGQIGALLGGRLMWWWLVITGWILMLGVVYLARFLQGRWKQMRVIEGEAEAVEELPELVPTAVGASAE